MLEIRPMNPEEIGFAVDLAAAEGWNPGLHDGAAFHFADPHGFLVGELDGRPVGCISAVSYDGRFGFIGLYIVIPEKRRQGLGIQLWNAAMSRLDGHNIGLDGVVEQQNNYRRSGFRLCHRSARFEYTPDSAPGAPPAAVVAVDPDWLAEVADYDRACFGAARERFLGHWLTMPDATVRCWREGGALRGYGVLRRCRSGCKIGPLFADDAGIAEALLEELCRAALHSGPIYLDVPETNEAACDLVARRGMCKVFETARMYTGERPAIDDRKVFGVTTFELG